MDPDAPLFDQAAQKLRQAMDRSTSGLQRMCLIDEALALYRRREEGEGHRSAAAGGGSEERPSV